MPFKSQAQRKFMFAAADRGELPKSMPHEWAHHTKGMDKLPNHVTHKHAALKMAYAAGAIEAHTAVFGKTAGPVDWRHKHSAEDATRPPPDDSSAALPPGEPPMPPGKRPRLPGQMLDETSAGMGDMELPPELANLSPEQLEQVLLEFGAPDEQQQLEAAGVELPPELLAEVAHGDQGTPPHEMPGGPGEDAPPGLPPEMTGDPNADGPVGLPPGMAGESMDGAEAGGPPHGKPTSEDFVNFAQGDDTDEEANPNKPPPTQAGTIPEKPPNWSGNASLEGGDAGTRNYQMGLPRSGAV